MAFTPENNDPKEPKLCDFSYISMTIPFLGLKMVKEGVFIAFFLLAIPISGSRNSFFLPFFEAKMTKNVILDQKIIVPNDYQQFWVHFKWFLSLFQNSEIAAVNVQAKSTQKWYFLSQNPF